MRLLIHGLPNLTFSRENASRLHTLLQTMIRTAGVVPSGVVVLVSGKGGPGELATDWCHAYHAGLVVVHPDWMESEHHHNERLLANMPSHLLILDDPLSLSSTDMLSQAQAMNVRCKIELITDWDVEGMW